MSRLALALGLALGLSARAEAAGPPKKTLKPGGYFSFTYDREGCRPAVKPRFYQVAVADLAAAKLGLAAAFASAGAADLTPGCDATSRWDPGLAGSVASFGRSIWIPRAARADFELALFALGTPQVSDEFGIQARDGSIRPLNGIDPAELDEYDALRRRLKENGADLADPVLRRVAEDRLKVLEPRVDVLRRTRDFDMAYVLLAQTGAGAASSDESGVRVVKATTEVRPPPSAGAEDYRRAFGWSASDSAAPAASARPAEIRGPAVDYAAIPEAIRALVESPSINVPVTTAAFAAAGLTVDRGAELLKSIMIGDSPAIQPTYRAAAGWRLGQLGRWPELVEGLRGSSSAAPAAQVGFFILLRSADRPEDLAPALEAVADLAANSPAPRARMWAMPILARSRQTRFAPVCARNASYVERLARAQGDPSAEKAALPRPLLARFAAACFDSSDSVVRSGAIRCLSELGDLASAPWLIRAARRSSGAGERFYALQQLPHVAKEDMGTLSRVGRSDRSWAACTESLPRVERLVSGAIDPAAAERELSAVVETVEATIADETELDPNSAVVERWEAWWAKTRKAPPAGVADRVVARQGSRALGVELVFYASGRAATFATDGKESSCDSWPDVYDLESFARNPQGISWRALAPEARARANDWLFHEALPNAHRHLSSRDQPKTTCRE